MVTPLGIGHFKIPAPRPLSALPGMSKLAGRMAEAIGSGLSSIRAAPWRVTAEEMGQEDAPLEEAESGLLRLESETGSITAMLAMDRQAASALVDAAMGGTGSEAAFEMQARPLSRMETALMTLVRAEIGKQLATAFNDVVERPFTVVEGSDIPELDRSGGVAHFRFVSNIFTYSGEVSLVFSRAELERQLASGLAGPEPDGAMVADRQRMQEEVGKAEVTLAIMLDPEVLSVDVLTAMRPGRFIELSATARSPVTVWSGGVPVFQGSLNRRRDRYAVTILSSSS